MISRFLLGLFLALVTVVVGFSSYLYLNGRQSRVAAIPQTPTAAQPTPRNFNLSGTLFMAQSGVLYSYSAGRFHQITTGDGWMQPSLTPDGNLIAVRKSGFYSDVYVLSRFGRPLKQLTTNVAPRRSYDTGDNHWSFYPRLSADGKTVYMSYDSPKYGYEVDMSIWAMPYGGTIKQGKLWTTSTGYTGGDMQPIPVAGGVLYTKYTRLPDGNIVSQLWFTNRPGSFGKALTSAADDCRDPSVMANGTYLAMVCTYGKQVSDLVIDPLSGANLGARKTVTHNQLVAQPVFAPDGSGIAYLAPAAPDGPFQLWFLPRLAYLPPVPSPVPTPSQVPSGPKGSPTPGPTPSPSPAPPPVKPIQLTTTLAFDATSTLAWAA